MWTKDTLASEVIADQKASLDRFDPGIRQRGCPALDFADAQAAGSPKLTLGEILPMLEWAVREGILNSAWPLDLIAAHHDKMYPDMRLLLMSLMDLEQTRTAVRLIKAPLTDVEKALVRSKGNFTDEKVRAKIQ